VQRLQVARRELALGAAIARLDRYDLLILDDIAYVTKDQAETSVLFELIAARYERRSLLITANQPFGEWGRILPDQAMTLAAIDRLVHHATILEMNVESYRRKGALDRKRARGRPRRTRRPPIDAQRQSDLAKPAARDNHPITRPPLLILIDAPFSSRLSRHTRGPCRRHHVMCGTHLLRRRLVPAWPRRWMPHATCRLLRAARSCLESLRS
jgi:hypothetical protein